MKAYSSKDLSGEEARLLLKKETEKEMKLAKLRAQLKKETQFNKRVEAMSLLYILNIKTAIISKIS